MALRILRVSRLIQNIGVRSMSGTYGDGSGKGGGTGGTIRDAGGSFGKMEAAREEQYVRKLEREQLKALKQHLDEEVTHHEKSIKDHQEAIERHKRRIKDLEKKHSDSD